MTEKQLKFYKPKKDLDYKKVKTNFYKICKEYGFDRDEILVNIQNDFNKKFMVNEEIIPKSLHHLIK